MQSRSPLFLLLFRVCIRLGLGLVLLVGLCVVMGGLARPTHAQSTDTVTDCSGENNAGQIGTVINNASSGDTINFSCNGTIPITSTLTITKNLTIDGSGQTVTLDGGNSVRVLSVNGGVTFALNAITIAHGSSGDGGGLQNNGTVTITNSTIANNSATSNGGLSNIGTMTITNSTIANNSASAGGGLGNFGGRTMTITNSTIANNSSSFGAGLVNAGSLTLSQSIVANNTGGGGDCHLIGPLFTDQGYNLDSDGTCGLTTANHDLPSTNPQLGPLADNGGPTQTLALLPGSPANDTIPSARCPSTDQRGVSRPDNGEATCDMGAYEFVDPTDHDLGLTNVPANITVDATSPHGAVVTYSLPTVVDEDSPLPTVSCSPASGSTFAIGTTPVTCTVSDSDDSNSPVSASFTVTVKGAAAQVSDLIATVNSFGLPPDIQASFDTQLQAVQTDLSNNNTKQACRDLTAFINHVKAQSGKQLTVSQANQLLAAAKQVQAVLGC